jgi:nucleotide-binding universal stress UspA family protein
VIPVAFKDILLVLITYPQATDTSEIQEAVSFAVAVDAQISALACVVQVRAPSQHLMSDAFVGALVASEREKSSEAAAKFSAAFEASAKKAGVFQETLTKECFTSDAPDVLIREARLRDLTIVPAILEGSNYRWYAESIVFGSGRPVLLLPQPSRAGELALDTVVIAWDGSRSAARAVADALPILERAKKARVLTVLNEKELGTESPAAELSKYLGRRGIDVTPDCIDAAGRRIGEILSSYVTSNQADLLVMGAYGHSRLREFILGGATRSMLSNPPLPILLSH